MRILYVADTLPDPDSGAAGTEYQTINALEKSGAKVDALWHEDLSHHIIHGNFHYLLELPYSIRLQMVKRLQSQRYDVVHVNQPHGFLAAKELHRKYSETIFIHRSHGFELRVKRELAKWYGKYGRPSQHVLKKFPSVLLGSLLDRHSWQITRYADGHIVSASECRDFLVDELRVPGDRVAVIPQAPPNSFLETAVRSFDAERLKRILYVGQFAFVKAPIVLAEVFNTLAEQRDDFYFTWVCSRKHHCRAKNLYE